MTTYSDKLKDPRWQKKRLEILERDDWMCVKCGDNKKTLHVHHMIYVKGKDPWEVSDDILNTLCSDCHELEHDLMKEYSDLLLEQVKSKFFADDLREIAEGFNNLKILHLNSVVATAIKLILTDPEFLLTHYFNTMEKKRNG